VTLDLEGHLLLFRAIGGADGALATIVHMPDMQAICSGDSVYDNIHMWLWKLDAKLTGGVADVPGRGGRPQALHDYHRGTRIPSRPTTTPPACLTSRAATSRTSSRRWPSPARRVK
jgi:hypothetical protein